jgi:hypothetical protein
MRSRVLLRAFAVAAFAAPFLTVSMASAAATYPGTKCVSDKIKAASGNCKAVLGAWSKFVGGGGTDTVKRDTTLTKAAGKMTSAWGKAETKATSKGADCVDTTLTDAATQAIITNAVSAIVADVTAGLTLSNSDDAKCGAALIKAAGAKCASILKAHAGFVGKQAAGTSKRDAAFAKADTKFTDGVNKALEGCPTTATLASLDATTDTLTNDVYTNSIVSQNVDDTQFTTISPLEFANPPVFYQGKELRPACSFGTPYHFFVKRGSVNKVVMYYQGGGACWSYNTCIGLGTFDKDVNPAGSDNPNNTTTGFGDLTNPNNPFKDWHIVFVSYCTGDIHFGDAQPFYAGMGGTSVKHRGYQNARFAEKWAREHFVAPEEVFVTGSSAGAYGAFFNAPLHLEVWPAAQFNVLGDAGNGIITPDFLTTPNYGFQQWNFEANLPENIPGIRESIEDGTGIPAFTAAVATYYPNARWAHYTSSFDGGTGGQTGFLNVMQNPGNVLQWVRWWDASCDWNSQMVSQATTTAALVPSNYRYYIGTGSRHTMYGSNKVYTDTTGGVPTIVDWVNEMLTGGPGWTNVQCSPASACGTLLPGDPAPSTRQCEGGVNDGNSCSVDGDCTGGVCGYDAPFDRVGGDIVITCP